MNETAKADPVRALIEQALGHLSTALDDLDSSPDRRPGGMVTWAMESLREALAQQAGADAVAWTTAKPTKPGAYWVKGYAIGRPTEKALVEVRLIGGELCSNLHAVNSDNDTDDFDALARHNDNFQWLGPLVVAPQPAIPEGNWLASRGNDPRIEVDSYAVAIEAALIYIGAERPDDDEPEEQWFWDKLTALLEIAQHNREGE